MKRDLSIEFLRCLLMALIVFYHACVVFDSFHPDMLVTGCGALTCFSTNCFAFISGWYGIRTTPSRIVRFLGLGLFFTLAFLAFGSGGVRYQLGWYGNAYLMLMLFAPIFNRSVESLADFRRVWFLLTGYMILLWLPLEKMGMFLEVDGWKGPSVYTVFYMYATGLLLSRTDWAKGARRSRVWAFVALIISLSVVLSFVSHKYPGLELHVWAYNSPFMVSLAIGVFLLFRSVSMPRKIHLISGFCAPSMFSVYLIHEGIGSSFFVPLMRHYERIMYDNGLPGICCAISVAGLIFLSCLCCDLVRRLMFAILKWAMAKNHWRFV